MKTIHQIGLTLALLAPVGLPSAQAAIFTWDGPATGNWSTTTNWNPDGTPANNDTINIGSGNAVTYDVSDFFLSNATVNLDGELTRAGVLRLQSSTFNVGSTGVISGGFRDLNNGTLTFDDGAQFTASNWEHKGTNVFTFNLGSTGFTLLTPGNLNSNGAVSTTYRADLANYTGGTQVVTLVDFGGDSTGLNNATFTGGGQYSLSILNSGSNAARLYWDDGTDTVRLGINQTVTWDDGGGDGQWKTGTNWDAPDNKAPIANDTVVINNDTVNFDGSSGSQLLPGSSTVNLVGSTLNGQSVIRLNNATINIDVTSTLSGDFWDLDDADLIFEDGAQATMANWEQKDINSFTYVLGPDGFDTLTPGTFRIGNGSLLGNIANATYIVDFAAFAGANGPHSITLMDFTGDATGMTDATFQNATFQFLNVDGPTLFITNPTLTWADAFDTITLNFDSFITPEPSSVLLLGIGATMLLAYRPRRQR